LQLSGALLIFVLTKTKAMIVISETTNRPGLDKILFAQYIDKLFKNTQQ